MMKGGGGVGDAQCWNMNVINLNYVNVLKKILVVAYFELFLSVV